MDCQTLVVEGQVAGEGADIVMGVYSVIEGELMNGRGVWKSEELNDYFIFYSTEPGYGWNFATGQVMEQGIGRGAVCASIESISITPADEQQKGYSVTLAAERIGRSMEEWCPPSPFYILST
jgi:hypothetical protein